MKWFAAFLDAELQRTLAHMVPGRRFLMEPVSDASLNFYRHMLVTYAFGQDLKLLMTLHINRAEALALAGQTAALGGESKALDFFKEFANVFFGFFKRQFEAEGIEIGHSLPLLCSGFDYFCLRDPTDTGRENFMLRDAQDGAARFACAFFYSINAEVQAHYAQILATAPRADAVELF